jgi:putative hydroxymethylpyrimidine transport system permease protein
VALVSISGPSETNQAIDEPVVVVTERKRTRLAGVRTFVRNYRAPALLGLGLITGWQVIFSIINVPSYLVPTPFQIANALYTDWDLISPALFTTLLETLYGFGFALVVGIGLAIALHVSSALRGAVYPLLIGSQTIPIIVIGPVLVIMLGYNIYPKIIIVALICFFPIVVNTLDGLGSAGEDFAAMMKTLDANRYDIFRRIELPASLPMMFSGIRVGVAYAAIGAVVAEWSGSNGGLGYLMLEAEPNLQTARIFAIIFLLTCISATLFTVVSVVQRFAIPWAPSKRTKA